MGYWQNGLEIEKGMFPWSNAGLISVKGDAFDYFLVF